MRLILAICATLTLAACHHHIRDSADIPDPPKPTETPTSEANVPPSVDSPPPLVHPASTVPSEPEPKLPPAKDPAKLIAETNGKLLDIFFAYDRSDLSPDAMAAAERDAQLLAAMLTEFPAAKLVIEGHCDERGSAEYNIALGDRRSSQAAAALRSLGLPPDRLETVSYGKERPQCDEPNESCWRRNRRAHLVLSLPASTGTLP